MLLVWKGWGVLAAIIPIIFIFLVQFITNTIFGNGFYKESNWVLPLVLLLSSITIYFIGTKLNSKENQIVIDKKTGEEIELKNVHSLFWIPMQYWGFIMLGLSILALVGKM